jgi:hypothetical protein
LEGQVGELWGVGAALGRGLGEVVFEIGLDGRILGEDFGHLRYYIIILGCFWVDINI